MTADNSIGYRHTAEELEAMVAAITKSGDYRVLRKIKGMRSEKAPPNAETKLAIFLDVETTGLDHAKDEIIELAMVPFSYSADGVIYEVGEPFQRFNQPRGPISQEITRITGITDDMVAGHKIDTAEAEAFAKGAALIVAHNASFDRRFMERLVPSFALKPWACSQSQVDWAKEGFEGTRLSYLVAGAGFFYDSHRASNDCLAAIELLASTLPMGGGTAMGALLERARKPSWRIWAENSPFELKDTLKARGYRWNADGSPFPKAWYTEVDDDAKDAELTFLKNEIYQRDIELLVRKIDAYNRFSDRQ